MKKSTFRKIQLLLFFVIAFQNFGMACDCWPYEPVFCRNVSEGSTIVRAVVINHSGPSYMEVVVLENINQEVEEDTITIFGQDGLNCGENLGQFNIQDTVILAVAYTQWEVETEFYWYLEGACGLHFLRYENGMVVGQVTDSLTSVPIQDFRDNLFDCLEMVRTGVDDIPKTNEIITLNPNPVTDIVQIETTAYPVLEVEVFNLSGQRMMLKKGEENRLIDLETGDLEVGVYFVKIHTATGILTRKFLKISK